MKKKTWFERNLKSKRALTWLIFTILNVIWFTKLYYSSEIRGWEVLITLIIFAVPLIALGLIEFEDIKIEANYGDKN